MKNINLPRFIVYYIYAGFGTLCTLFTIVTICWIAKKPTLNTRLILHLLTTVFVLEITVIPYAYTSNNGLCSFVGFFYTWMYIANVLTLLLMVICNRSVLFKDFSTGNLKEFIDRARGRATAIIYLVPGFYSACLFGMKDFYGAKNGYCTVISDDSAQYMVILVVWIILLAALTIFGKTVYDVSKLDIEMSGLIFQKLGNYIVITMLCVVPRTLLR